MDPTEIPEQPSGASIHTAVTPVASIVVVNGGFTRRSSGPTYIVICGGISVTGGTPAPITVVGSSGIGRILVRGAVLAS
jgi:hypothetical protein